MSETLAIPQVEAPPAAEEPKLPEKFKDVGELIKAYGELEKKLGAPPAAEEKPVQQQATEKAGVSVDDIQKEILENGQISAETYEKFKAAGIGRDVVNAIVGAQQTQAAAFVQEVHGVAGGEDQYGELTAWAALNYTEAEQIVFDEAVKSGNVIQAKQAVRALKDAYIEANGKPANLVKTSGTKVPGVEPLVDQNEVYAAMKDPRYKTDAGYRRQVEARIAAGLTQ